MLATCVVQPMDLIKNRMQLSGEGVKVKLHKTSLHAIGTVVRNEGYTGLYTGLSAGLLRQATYATARLGVFSTLMDRYSVDHGHPPGLLTKITFGMIGGCAAAVVGTPAELVLIRMTADGRLPPDQRRNYKNAIDALLRVSREEGVMTLWRGCLPTMGRSMVVNAAQLSSYTQSKQLLLTTAYFEDNILCHLTASMISGLVTALASMPVDIAKTRIQNMRTIDGKPEYRGTLDVLYRVLRHEGVLALWKGLTPYYGRVGPHTVLTFIFLEQAYKIYNEIVK